MRKIVFSLVLCLLSPLYALNRSEIRSNIRDMVLDSGATASKQEWSSTTINTYINLAQLEIARLTWCQKNSYTFTISTFIGTSIYALQDDIASIERVTIHNPDTAGDVSYKEDCVTLKETSMLSLDDGDWETKFSTYSYGAHDKPTQYYTYQSTGVYLNMGFDPPAKSSYTITVYYVEIPDDLTSDTNTVTGTPFRGINQLVPYHELICFRVASIFCAFDKKPGLSRYYFSLYEAMLKDGTKSLNWKQNFQPNMQGSWE